MVENTTNIEVEAFWIVASAAALIVFSVFLAWRSKARRIPSGSKRHRKEPSGEFEQIKADGYIDSFAGEIEEGGGEVTPLIKIVTIAVLIWWAGYIIYYWSPR